MRSLELFRLLGGFGTSKTGQEVNHATALRVTTVLACARVIAEGISQVPFKLHQSAGLGSAPARDHSLYEVLALRPNGWMTSFELREMMAMHACLTGGALAVIVRGIGGRVAELLPVPRHAWTAKQERDYSITYSVTMQGGEVLTLGQDRVWHWRGPSWDGVVGLDVISLAREAVGLAMATEESQASLHANGLRVSGVYSVDKELTEQQFQRLRKWLADHWGGSDKSGMPLIADRNAKWTPTTMNGVDAQHLETRKYQVEEVCRALRVLPIMVGHSDKTQTFASVEQMMIAHVVHTMMPWYTRIEQSADVQLLTAKDRRDGLFTKFNAAALMRGSHADRSQYLSRALGAGGAPAWMTQDEARALEELPPMGGTAAALPVATNVGGGA